MCQREEAKTSNVAVGTFSILERKNYVLFNLDSTYLHVSVRIICSAVIPLHGSKFFIC